MKRRVNLTFPRTVVGVPITYRLARDFNVAANIIRAQVAPDQVGKMVLELQGDMDQIDSAIEWMRSLEITVSLQSKEIVIDEDACVDCGLCTGVCPTQSLSLNPHSFRLSFNRSTCSVCEQCIPACPVNAISVNL
ncbi:MAG: NIL domain-containing protein [Pseudanabaenaceae cyanobacterium]